MKSKNKYSNKVNKNNKNEQFNSSANWIIKITSMAFFLSLALSFTSDTVIPNVPIYISTLLLIIFVVIGIVFDMIGVSVTVAQTKIFNSMASKKVRGAKTALLMIKNKSKVSSFCNDVIGDVCGVISGATGIGISTTISSALSINLIIVNLIITSLIASITIGGKALGKGYAINKANKILFHFARFIEIITFK